MEAKLLQSLHMTTWTGSDNMFPKSNNSIGLCTRFENNKKRVNMLKCNLCDKPETLSRLQTFWIPEVRRLKTSVIGKHKKMSSCRDRKTQDDEQLPTYIKKHHMHENILISLEGKAKLEEELKRADA